MSGAAIKNHAGFIWSVADLLRGVYKQSEYGRVILPLTVLRRLDCVLEPTKAEVLETMADLPETLRNREPLLQQVAGQPFVNMLEAVVALPDQLFYNTGISTYFWVVTNRKAPHRRGKVQLIDARDSFTKMRKSLGQKRKEISAEQIADITRLYGAFEESSRVKIFPNESFGFLRITVERPLQLRWEITDDTLVAVESDKKIAKLDHPRRDALFEALRNCRSSQYATEKSVKAAVQAVASTDGTTPTALVKAVTDALAVRDPEAPVITDRAGNPKPDPDLRDNENVPLPKMSVAYEPDPTARLETIEYRTAVDDYLETEVHPYVPDAWHDPDKTKIGYEIPLTRHFYTYTPPRPVHEIDTEIKQIEQEIQALLAQVAE